jgi:hypothetical protein
MRLTDREKIVSGFAGSIDELLGGHRLNLDQEREFLRSAAPNAVEFIARREFMDSPSIYAHYGAYLMVRDYFQLLCPLCAKPSMYQTHRVTKRGNVNKTRMEYESEPLLRWNEDYADDQCPKCHVTRSELVDEGRLRRFTQGISIVGQRGGKSYTLGQISCYQEHFLLTRAVKYGSVSAYFDLPASSTFVSTCIAASAEQTEKTIWLYHVTHRKNAPWFQRMVSWIKAQEAAQVVPLGMRPWAYVENATSIEYGCYNWVTNALNSNAATGRGGTRLWVLMDEISHFKDTDSAFGAQENYEAMQASLATVRSRTAALGLPSFLGSIFAISSPKSLDDYGYRLMVTAPENPSRYALHRATWEFSPEYPSPDAPGLIEPRLSNPVKFWTNFGARPPSSAQPIHPDFESWRARVEHREIGPILTPFVTAEVDEKGTQWLLADVDDAELAQLTREAMPPGGFVITCDAGQKFDAFSLTIGHSAMTSAGRTTIQDVVFRIVPGEGQEVLFASVEAMIMKIAKVLPITRIRFDRWQSAQIVQNLDRHLASKNVDVAQETMKDEAIIRLFREGAEGLIWMLPGNREAEKNVRAGERTAQDVVWHELQSLQWDPKSDKIFNPKKGKVRGENSDDVARVVAYLHQEVQNLEYIERDDNSKEAQRKRAAAFTASSRVMGFGGFVGSAEGSRGGGGSGLGGGFGSANGSGGPGVGAMSSAMGLGGFGGLGGMGDVGSLVPPAVRAAQAAQMSAAVAAAERGIGETMGPGRYVTPVNERTRGSLTPPRIGGFMPGAK